MRFLKLVAAMSLALLAQAPAHAAIVLDQSAVTVVQAGNAAVIARVGTIAPAPSDPFPPRFGAVQTFTSGLNGRLDSLLFQAAQLASTPSGFVVMSLIDGDYETGARSVVWQGGAPFAALPTLTAANGGLTGLLFDVSGADYQVAVGQRYSVLFEAQSPVPVDNIALVIGQGTRPGPTPPVFSGPNYAGGRFLGIRNDVLLGASPIEYDIGFQSFVDVQAPAVPEASTWIMMILGFGCAGVAVRRRARTSLPVALHQTKD
jgi:PEP-CTERM motif